MEETEFFLDIVGLTVKFKTLSLFFKELVFVGNVFGFSFVKDSFTFWLFVEFLIMLVFIVVSNCLGIIEVDRLRTGLIAF